MRGFNRHSSGFTLLETLVAVALTSLILFMLIIALQRGAHGTARLQAVISSEEEGRIALQSIISDVRYGTNWEQAYLQSLEGKPDEWGDDEIGFFLHIAPERQPQNPQPVGTLCFVHYYLDEAFEFPNDRGRFTRILFRRVFNSAEVKAAVAEGPSMDSLLNHDSARDEMIAFDVVSFRIVGQSLLPDGSIAPWTPPENPPREIEIEFVIASEELATSLSEPSDWENSPRLGEPSQWPIPGLARYRAAVLVSNKTEAYDQR